MMEETPDGSPYIRCQLDLAMVTGRYSSVLVTELMRCVEHRSANIVHILDEIGGLEGAPHSPTDAHQGVGSIWEATIIWPLAQTLCPGGFYSEECTQSLGIQIQKVF